MPKRPIALPTPDDWFRVLVAARAVLADFEQDPAFTLDDVAEEVTLRDALTRCAANLGVPMALLDDMVTDFTQPDAGDAP